MVNQLLENRENRRDAATLEQANREEANASPEDKAVNNIIRTWNGGEHVLAGARASELLYAKGDKPNQKLLDRLMQEGALGIERYLTPPKQGMTEIVGEQSGYPLATQPENREPAVGASNASSEAAKSDQDAIDKTLEAGRSHRENSNTTALNPADSEVEAGGKNKSAVTRKGK
jgi:hypothetical protein